MWSNKIHTSFLFFIAVLTIVLNSCISKKKYLELESIKLQYDTTYTILYNQATNYALTIKDLQSQISMQDSIIFEKDSLLKIYSFRSKQYHDSLAVLKSKFDSIANGPENLYKQAIIKFNEKNYKEANQLFLQLIEEYPSSELRTPSNRKIKEISKISFENRGGLLLDIKEQPLKEQLNIIEVNLNELYLNYHDSIAIAKRYSELLAEYEKEKYIIAEKDEMQSCYFYQTTRQTTQTPYYGYILKFEIYIVKEYSGKKYLRLRTRYESSDWMFYEKVIIRGSNGSQITINTEYPQKKSDTKYGGDVVEWSDNKLSNSQRLTLFKIAKSEEIKVRYTGKYQHEMTLNSEQIKALKEIIAKYNLL